MCVYKVTFTNGGSANILAKNKEDIVNIIANVFCGNDFNRIRNEAFTCQRIYKNGTMGKEFSFRPNGRILTEAFKHSYMQKSLDKSQTP